MKQNSHYKGFYINLSDCIDRRIFIEHQLRKLGVLENYTRFEAIKSEDISQNTRLTKSEIACLQSHIQVLRSCKNSDSHIHIIEDDIKFSPFHHKIIEKFFSINDDWDILFTGIQIPLMKRQINRLINIYQKQSDNMDIHFFDMSDFLFVGAFSYIINKKSISKILAIYDKQTNTQPIDFILRQHICIEKDIKARCVFPMVAIHSGEIQTTMKDRKFELTYKYQYLFQKPFIANTNLSDIYNEIKEYGLSIGYEIKNNNKDIASIYDELLKLGDYINNSPDIHGKYRK